MFFDPRLMSVRRCCYFNSGTILNVSNASQSHPKSFLNCVTIIKLDTYNARNAIYSCCCELLRTGNLKKYTLCEHDVPQEHDFQEWLVTCQAPLLGSSQQSALDEYTFNLAN